MLKELEKKIVLLSYHRECQQILVYPYNGTLLSNKKWTTDTCKNMNDPEKHLAASLVWLSD